MAKKGKKAKAGKLPREIAGVKLPKPIRQAGEALLATARSPEGARLIAAGLSIAAGAVALAAERRQGTAPGKPAVRPGAEASSPGESKPFADAIGGVADAFLAGFFKARAPDRD